jgi:cold shock protein
MKTGVISWFSDDKGYGFIKPDDKSKDVFLHINELKNASCQLIDSSTAKLYKPVKVICNIKKAQ